MTPTDQQLKDAIKEISFEMNRYLYTAHPKFSLPGRYPEVVAESCLLHSRAIGDFFFKDETIKDKRKDYDDIKISHYYHLLKSKDELEKEIEKSKLNWSAYKKRTDKKLCHLTYSRVGTVPMNMKEKAELNFERLIELFEQNLPSAYKEQWDEGKSFSE